MLCGGVGLSHECSGDSDVTTTARAIGTSINLNSFISITLHLNHGLYCDISYMAVDALDCDNAAVVLSRTYCSEWMGSHVSHFPAVSASQCGACGGIEECALPCAVECDGIILGGIQRERKLSYNSNLMILSQEKK